MNRLYFLYLLIFSAFSITAFSQDTLPKFSVRNAGKERYVIGWVNNYEQVSQISIQRSFDSLRNFKTILSVADPNSKQNGYVDKDAVNDHMFYRLFIVLSGGSFFFTEAKKPFLDTAKKGAGIPNKTDNVSIQNPLNPQDQIANTTKTKDTIAIVKKEIFVPSFYVYTSKKDGNVFLNLPNADEKKYSVKFFEEDGTPLFEIKTIKETSLIIDKANFLHAGWFRFELYEGEKLKEKHKFYLAKDF
jgi:hypothetical protein